VASGRLDAQLILENGSRCTAFMSHNYCSKEMGMSSAKDKTGNNPDLLPSGFRDLAHADPQIRIEAIRRGIPASSVEKVASRLGKSKAYVIDMLGLSSASISRKEREGVVLSKNETERLLGMEILIATVQSLVEQSGNPIGFNASHWVSDWLTKPLPALAGVAPASYMDTFEGQQLVKELITMSQSGAYA